MLMKKMLAIILVSLVLSGCEKNGSQNDLIINNTEEENVVMDENDDYELKNIEMGRKEEKDISDRLRKMVGKCKRIYSQADKGNASNIVLEEETVHTMIESIAEENVAITCGALLESASIQLAKNERRADAGRAVESVFAEYQKDLLERYGIFAIEGSYESGTMSEENILNRLSFYGAENIETEIAAIRYLTDQNGKEFLRQAVEYEKMKTGAAAIENLTGKVSEWKEQELKANEYGKENIETSKELDQMLESEKEELPAENNPLADIVDIQAQALLNLVSPEGFTLSSKAVKSEETVSNRKLRQGYGTMKEKDNGAGDTIFFNLYLIDKFGNAANKKKNTVLDYEMEYLLGGKASDKDNLEYVIGRIRILRFAVNYGYLLTDKDMQMEVDTLATTLSAVFLSPEIGPVIKHALLLAWAYGESLTDVKTLLAGKKVPAVKSKESWNLTLDGLLELAKNRSIPEGKETEEGNSYEQYLQMMLVLKSKEELSMRALDLVEMNLRSGMEKTFFRADACVSGADFDMTCYLRRGIRYQYHILYQYQ